MKNKKIKSVSCCSDKKKIPLIILGIIVITMLILLIPYEEEIQTEVTPAETPLVVEAEEIASEPIEAIVIEPEIIIEEELVADEPALITLDTKSLAEVEMTESEMLVQNFINQYNQEEFAEACETLIDTKCDATISASVARFGQEFSKMDNGYENLSVRQADTPDFHSDVICVEYDYRYQDSSNPDKVHETMSYYVQDGKITYRICEAKSRGGENIGCPIQARRDFCL